MSEPNLIQPLVRNLMQTLLNDPPSILTESDLSNLSKGDYCRYALDLKIEGHPLLRRQEEGTAISGHNRYYQEVYTGRYLVTKEWWKQYHLHNAKSLLRWVEKLIHRNPNHPGIAALENHRAAFQNYLNPPE